MIMKVHCSSSFLINICSQVSQRSHEKSHTLTLNPLIHLMIETSSQSRNHRSEWQDSVQMNSQVLKDMNLSLKRMKIKNLKFNTLRIFNNVPHFLNPNEIESNSSLINKLLSNTQPLRNMNRNWKMWCEIWTSKKFWMSKMKLS